MKYHFKTDQGIDFLTQEDADRMAGEDGDYHQRDLYTSIEDGNFPSWTLHVQIMPFEDAKTYRFNPFDLTKVWPHGDYPLHEVGRMTLNRNVADYHAADRAGRVRAEQHRARHRPEPGQDAAGPRVLLLRRAPRPARGELQADPGQRAEGRGAHATPRTARCGSATPPIRCTRRTRWAAREADPKRAAEVHWASDGDMVRTAYTLRPDDDDWGQPGTLVREVLDDEARDRLAHNIIGHVSEGVREPVLSRVFEYWRNVDPDLGKKVEEGVRANTNANGK